MASRLRNTLQNKYRPLEFVLLLITTLTNHWSLLERIFSLIVIGRIDQIRPTTLLFERFLHVLRVVSGDVEVDHRVLGSIQVSAALRATCGPDTTHLEHLLDGCYELGWRYAQGTMPASLTHGRTAFERLTQEPMTNEACGVSAKLATNRLHPALAPPRLLKANLICSLVERMRAERRTTVVAHTFMQRIKGFGVP